ncbi:MAG: hypothetical protein MUE36_13495 [Acidimicrobiales bacterium]|jgi:hypothetical protein|nr:hypothetical protein [Acidimicrobiales bacterium]
MSREQLVEAYVGGRMGRRVFIRGLVALGVSTAAALTYADALSASTGPFTAAADDLYAGADDLYPPTDAQGDQATRGGAGAGAGAASPVSARPRFTG